MVGSLCFLAISWKHFFFPANIPPGQCPWRKIMPQCPDMSVKFHTRHSLVRPSNRLCPTRILFVTLSGCPMLWKRSHTRFNVLPFFAGFSRKVKRRINLLFSLPALILMPFLKKRLTKGVYSFQLASTFNTRGNVFSMSKREHGWTISTGIRSRVQFQFFFQLVRNIIAKHDWSQNITAVYILEPDANYRHW